MCVCKQWPVISEFQRESSVALSTLTWKYQSQRWSLPQVKRYINHQQHHHYILSYILWYLFLFPGSKASQCKRSKVQKKSLFYNIKSSIISLDDHLPCVSSTLVNSDTLVTGEPSAQSKGHFHWTSVTIVKVKVKLPVPVGVVTPPLVCSCRLSLLVPWNCLFLETDFDRSCE